MQVKIESNKLILSGELTYKYLDQFIRISKRKAVSIVDITRAKTVDTLFLVYLLKSDLEILARDEQEKLIEIVRNNLKSGEFEIKRKGFFYEVGYIFIEKIKELYLFLAFIGEILIKGIGLIVNPKRFRVKMIFKDIELMGFNAVPILATISFLIGAVIAYHGAVRLKQFGANIFVVDLVSVSVLRELGPLIVAILLAGRSASSYTTQIGIMKVTEEIDVIKTMGVEPFDILVFPKIISMLVSVPLLIVLADVSGIVGGMVVAKLSLGVTLRDFILRLHHAITVNTFLAGLLKAPAFAFLIATIGSFKGFRTQKNVESIGKSVTISVVDSIFAVIIADAIFSVLFRWVGM